MDNLIKEIKEHLEDMDTLGEAIRTKAHKYYEKNPEIIYKRGKHTIQSNFVRVEGEGTECKIVTINPKTGKEFTMKLISLWRNQENINGK